MTAKISNARDQLDYWIKLIGFEKTMDSHPLKQAMAAFDLILGTPEARFRYIMDELEKRFPDPEPWSAAPPEERYLKMIDDLLKQ